MKKLRRILKMINKSEELKEARKEIMKKLDDISVFEMCEYSAKELSKMKYLFQSNIKKEVKYIEVKTDDCKDDKNILDDIRNNGY